MAEGGGLDEALLKRVAAEDLERIPDSLSDEARFAVAAIRVATKRDGPCDLCVFVHSAAPAREGERLGLSRVFHMQTGHGDLDGAIVLTSRDANNGAIGRLVSSNPVEIMAQLEQLGLSDRWTLFWEGSSSVATFYPAGTQLDAPALRYLIPVGGGDLTQDEVCRALNIAYNDNMKTPTAHTIRLWVSGKLIDRAEDEIERHLNGQLSLYFAAKDRNVKILAQTNNDAGRTDLIFLQHSSASGPMMAGVLELKVLRGPLKDDVDSTREGLSQGYHYRNALGLPFATLALYDVAKPPSFDVTPLLMEQDIVHLQNVRTRRFPLYSSPKAWRDGGAFVAA